MKIKQLSHEEQMEAKRYDFEKWWSTKAVGALRNLKVPRQFWPAVKHVAWSAFSSRK